MTNNLRIPTALLAGLLLVLASGASADPGRLYTQPDPAAPGGIEGSAGIVLTHALAVEHDRLRVYRAELSDGGKAFRFSHLPVGKYDLVLVAKNRAVYEGIVLGDPTALAPVPLKNLETRVAVADTFFNRSIIHRTGLEGERVLAFVERLRDKLTLKQSAEKLNSNLRRLEIIELQQATDDWQMSTTRHLYREEEPIEPAMPFLQHHYVSGLGNLRVVDSVNQLGPLTLPANPAP